MFATIAIIHIPLEWIQSEGFLNCTTNVFLNGLSYTRVAMCFFPSLQDIILRFILFLQILEWYSMHNIMKHQQGKEIGQILFEHNAENMDETLYWRNAIQFNFRKKEIFAKKVIFVLGILWFLITFLLEVSSIISNFEINSKLFKWNLGFDLSVGICITYFFASLMYTLKTHHNFEYEK